MTGSAHENAIDVIRHNRVDHIGDLVLTLCPQITFEFGIFVEMILDRTLRAARDKNQISDARLDGLLDGILNDRFVNNREKLFRHGLGGRKKTGAKSSNGKDGFCYRVHHVSLFNHGCSKHPSRSEEHTSELQSLRRISYAVFCLKKKNNTNENTGWPVNNTKK